MVQNGLFTDSFSDNPIVKLSEICRSRSTGCPARVRQQFFQFWATCFVFLCGCSSVIAGDDIGPVGRIRSDKRLSAQVQVGTSATFAGFQPRVSGTTRYHVGFLANPDGRFTLVATVTRGVRQVETVLATSESFALPNRSGTLSLTQLPGSSSWLITCLVAVAKPHPTADFLKKMSVSSLEDGRLGW